MFRALEAKLIFLVWIFLVTECINACQIDKVYKLDEYDCRCVSPTPGRRWHMNCFLKKSPENRTAESAISSTTDGTPPTSTSGNVETTISSSEPRSRTQRIHTSKLSQGSSPGVQKLPRTARETGVREIEHLGKNKEIWVFSIEYEPSAERGGPAYLDISCQQGDIEKEGLLEKLEDFNVRDVAGLKFRGCALPKRVTYAQIIGNRKHKISKFSLNSPRLDSPILPKGPFEDYTEFIHEFYVTETKNRKSSALEDFEEGFFASFSNLTFLSLTRNKILSTKALEFIPNLEALNLSGNPLKNLTADTFRNLTKLQWLNLGDCEIESIHKDAFATLVELGTLELFRNFLKALPPESFRATVKLGNLSLNLNNFTEGFPETVFDHLESLVYFTCVRCGIKKLGPKTFHGMTKLHRLDLSHNKISTLDRNIFSGVVRLRVLDLSSNNLTDIEGLVLPSQLEILNMKDNELKSFPENVLHPAQYIVAIDLSNNMIESLKPRTFSTASQLEELNLSGNSLSGFSIHLSSHLIKIKHINLSKNHLTSLPPIFTQSITHLEKFDVSDNDIRVVRMQNFRTPRLEIDLRRNPPLETIDVSEWNLAEHGEERITYIINNPLKCDCHLLDFYRYYKFNKTASFGEFSPTLKCRDRRRDQPQNVVDQLEEDFRCPLNETQGCPPGCSCDYTEDPHSVRVDCSGLNLATGSLPQLPINVTELNLANTSLGEVPDFERYPLLQRIDLRNNRIRILGNLQENKYTVDLTGNRLRCDCTTQKALFEYFKLVDLKYKKDIECDASVDQGYLRLIDFLADDSCRLREQKAFTGFVVTLTCSAALLVVLLVVLYYKNRRRIIVYMYNYHYNIYLFIWPVHEIENDKMYDAFISFSDHDSSVVNEIVSELEKPDPVTGEKIYKLCRHDRDWIPGNSITYNISHSVQNSCRTILVLSENFLTSAWLNVELKTALTQMVGDKSHKLIIIVIGELPPEKKLDVELRALLQNTYLKWSNPRFWDHLRYLLPHKKQKNKGIDKTKAVLNNYGHPMTKILLENRPTSASVARTAEILENEKNRLKSISRVNGGSLNGSDGQINEAYVAISTEDISVHCDSFKEANKPRVASGRHRPPCDNAVRPPRKKDKHFSEA